MDSSNFSRQEKAVLKVTFEEQRYMSTREISRKAQMSWITAKKYTKQLIERKWLLLKRKKMIFNYSMLGIKRRSDK